MGERQNAFSFQYRLAFAADDKAGIAQEQALQILLFRELQIIVRDSALPVHRTVEGRMGAELEKDLLLIGILNAVADLKRASAQDVGENQLEFIRVTGQRVLIL
ncbi:hypothetical protein D3C79_807010 [compost metagenome]